MTRLFLLARDLDASLCAVPRPRQYIVLTIAIVVSVCACLPYVPRQYLDYSGLPVLDRIAQYETYGPDSLSDMYEARVVLNDIRDMYTKRLVEQTPLEAATWSKAASGPYPPAALLVMAGLYAVGERTGLGFYGMILGCALLFGAMALVYCLKTRWYVFLLLCANLVYFGYRFVYVQDNSYLVMLVAVMAALFLARGGRATAHVLMAVAITLKLSPLFYAKNVFGMRRSLALVFIGILVAGLVLPYFIWENYLYIYRLQVELKDNRWYETAGALAIVVPFAIVLWYVEVQRGFDMEERLGWDLLPFAMLLAITTNSARHLLIVLLVPDKRGVRNVVATIGLGLHYLFPRFILLGSVVYITIALLSICLVYHLREIGYAKVLKDLLHPFRSMRTGGGRLAVR